MESSVSTPHASAVVHASEGSPEATTRLATLDSWLDRSAAELEPIYRNASVPKLLDVRGDLRGRMLAWPALDRSPGIAGMLRAFAGSAAFPWRGKSFTPYDAQRGEGINRVFVDRFKLFRFDTHVGRSRAGDFDAVQLDYDLEGNPPFIRSIKDEIREVAPGLWLGQAWLALRRRDVLVLYFGLARAGA
jgi:hypothetical protein